MTDRAKLCVELGLDRVLAHQVLFAHRHKDKTPAFHIDMINDFHSDHPRVEAMAFRGGAKSTIFEEGVIIKALFREFKNAMVIGSSIPLAAERIESIRHEFETNEKIEELFGSMIGGTWTDTELVLANGVRIISRSRGQAMRGTKFRDTRPDFVFVDDIEDDEDTIATLRATKKWFYTTLIPALDARPQIRMAATPVHVEALAEDNRKDPTWLTKVFPIKYRDEAGEWRATWPDRFPLADIDDKQASFRQRGMTREFNMEFMCEAASPEDKVFHAHKFKVEPTVRTWQAVYGMFDPARTVKATSATTGFASWSWISNRLVVWDAWGRRLLPDEIVTAVFDFAERDSPTWIGVEEDGLNEFLLQPIRQEVTRRGFAVPYRAVRAPPGKHSFIRGLQPFFNAREITFAQPLPDLETQLLGFPQGDIDVPNALAYALKMRPGAPIYDDFGVRYVGDGLRVARGQPCYLALNAGGGLVTGCLAQAVDGSLRVLGDYVREGDAGEWVDRIVQAAQLDAGRTVRVVCGPQHFERYTNTGLVQAVKRLPAEVRRGVDPQTGRAWIRSLMQRESRGAPLLLVGENARWTLNAFAGGYSKAMLKGGVLADHAEEGAYKVLCEGLESFTGLLRTGVSDDERTDLNYAFTPGGQRYVTALRR